MQYLITYSINKTINYTSTVKRVIVLSIIVYIYKYILWVLCTEYTRFESKCYNNFCEGSNCIANVHIKTCLLYV